MKVLKISFLLSFLILSSCNVNNPMDLELDPAFSLAVGNKYIFDNSGYTIGSPYLANYFTYKLIISDTIANGKQYFVFDDGMMLRSERNTVYQLLNGSERIYFSFDVEVGDIVIFEGLPYLVKEIETRDIFDQRTKVITIIHANFSPDSRIQYSFARKFGLLSYHHINSNSVLNSNLMGAIINGTVYGRILD